MESLNEKVNPYYKLVGQPVPPVTPEALKAYWITFHDLLVTGMLMRIKIDSGRLEDCAVSHRMTLLRVLYAAMPSDTAFRVMAELPLTWPKASEELTFNACEFARLCALKD